MIWSKGCKIYNIFSATMTTIVVLGIHAQVFKYPESGLML